MISIIIVNYSVEYFLKQCIESLLKCVNSNQFEIIVVDNYSYDKSLSMLDKNFKEIKVIKNNKNIGFSAAVNLGIKNSLGEYICIINPDTLIKDDTLYIMKNYLSNNPDTGIIGCKVLNPNGKLQYHQGEHSLVFFHY